MLLDFVVLTLGVTAGNALVSYRSMAERNGWIIGAWLRKEASVPAMLGFVLCVVTVARGLFYVEPWWLVFGAVAAGYLAGLLATVFLKNWAPVVFAPLAAVVLLVQVFMLTQVQAANLSSI